MVTSPFRDLPPKGDPKGGSPRTPSGGVPVREYQEFTTANGNGVWKTLAGAAGGLWIMALLAWWTAYSGKGVTQEKLEDYVDKHSPYLMDKGAIIQSQQAQDTQIGMLAGKQERMNERLGVVESDMKTESKDIEGMKHDIKLVSDYLEQLKVKR